MEFHDNEEPRRTCELCGAKTVKYRHSLNKTLVKGLYGLYSACKKTGYCHAGDPDFSLSVRLNFPKLRYWGLVEKYEKHDIRVGGYWRVTQKGFEFLFKELPLQKTAIVYRNVTVGFEGKEVTAKTVDNEFFKNRLQYALDAEPHQIMLGEI